MATATAKGMRIRPSIEALAMADVDCAFNDDDDDDQDAPPPEHLRAFEAFIETVTSTIWLYTSGRIFTSQTVRLENRL
jgi:hypothetical protein